MALRSNSTKIMGGATRRWTMAASPFLILLATSVNALITCPRPGKGPSTGNRLTPGATVTINVAPMDQLCTLVRLTTEGSETNIVAAAPVGRSYNQKKWESVQGPYTSVMTFNCQGGGSTTSGTTSCTTTLPMLDDPTNEKYALISYSHKVSEKEEISRFLQQTTFGPKRSEIAEFKTYYQNFADWIQNQMNVRKVGLTSHREYFRTRANARATDGTDQIIATADKPCDVHSRWKRYTFGYEETLNAGKQTFQVKIPKYANGTLSTEWFVIFNEKKEDEPLTEVQQSTWGAYLKDGERFEVCPTAVAERAEGSFAITLKDNKNVSLCVGIASGNPLVQFHVTKPKHIIEFPNNNTTKILQEVDTKESKGSEFVLKQSIPNDVCSKLPIRGGVPVHATQDYKTWYLHDPRMVLQSNTVESPIVDGGGANSYHGRETKCSAAPRTFLNEEQCYLSMEDTACVPSTGYAYAKLKMRLDESNLRKWYETTGSLVYALNMTNPIKGPCQLGGTSRWMKRNDLTQLESCSTMAGVSTTTKNTIKNLIKDAIANHKTDQSIYIKDIKIPSNANQCDAGDSYKGMKIWLEEGATCWEHVHDDELNIYDFTDWSVRHGTQNFSGKGTSPIKQFADRGEVYLTFPAYKWPQHEQGRWTDNKQYAQYIGRYGEKISFGDVNSTIRTELVAEVFGASGTSEAAGKGSIVCGSPYEVANDPLLGDEFDVVMEGRDRTESLNDFEAQKWSVWNTISLYSTDQLRQRMAFALSQIFTMVPDDIDDLDETESHLAFYDIFVRHAFGKYEDILKEVAYHPMMAEMLTFMDNKSSGYANEKLNLPNVFPDENFAREIMQLFSIGLIKLNMNGTAVVRQDGTPVQTYSNLNIMDNARAWTGFTRQYTRGNIEDVYPYFNRIDPMQIDPEWRDPMPKANIYDEGYIGDSEVPLCMDLPPQMFLKKGATYRLLGSNKMPQLVSDPQNWIYFAMVQRLTLNTESSGLYAALCNDTDGDGVCEYPMTVVLDKTIQCFGEECRIDEPRVVQMGGTSPNIYYEYVRPPCVQFPFYNSALKIKRRNAEDEAMCADPRMNVASEACCNYSSLSTNRGYFFPNATRNCMYPGERVHYETAVKRCNEKGWETCSTRELGDNYRACSGPYNCCLYNEHYYWTNSDCEIKIKINNRGEIAVTHNHTDIDSETGKMRGYIQDSVKDDNVNFFRVHWRHGSFPSMDFNSCNGNCKEDPKDPSICVCKVAVIESQVFQTLPQVEHALKMLKIGAPNPASYNDGDCKVLEQNDLVKAWDCTNSKRMDEDTIFEVTRGLYPKYYLKNTHSSVLVNDGAYAFRNPPHFMTLNERTVRDAQYETDAVLRQFVYHPNTPPFIARRIIQRFGVSNPSPGYIEAVAMAFLSGRFTSGGHTFGSGNYGDLGATCAATLLHDEARSVVLDADPSYGSLREPLLRVMHVMRSLEIVPNEELYPHIKTISMREKIGQMAHSIPNVFSYFLPDYIPPGRANAASIYSPEAGVVNTPTVVGIVGGLFSLVKYGLASCHAGFGPSANCGVGAGQLTYQPPSAKDLDAAIEELSLLLTAGRLTRDAKNLIKLTALDGYNFDEQVRIVQQLIMTTPEFHASGVVERKQELRPEPDPPVYSKTRYKNLVFLFLEAGFDSFNLMVPDNEKCERMYKMYNSTRGPLALSPNGELTEAYSAAGSQKACDSWKFHKSASTIAQLFGKKDAIVFSNIGVLLEPGVNKENWEDLHRGTVLFAHDKQQVEVKRVDPFHTVSGTGVLGRITDALTTTIRDPKYKTGSISLGGVQALTGEDGVSPLIKHVNEKGASQFDPLPSSKEVLPALKKLNNITAFDSNVFGDFWSGSMVQSLAENQEFFDVLDNVTLANGLFTYNRQLARQLEVVSKLIMRHERRGIDRDFFYLFRPGWDVHGADSKARTAALLEEVDQSLKEFVDEIEKQGKWDDTLIVCLSEFGRTLTADSGGGSDHAWGGQAFIAGGSVKGGRILGEYPENYNDYDVSRGRLYPAIPFDSMWNGVAKWMGVPDEKMDKVLPNREKFEGDLYEVDDLFERI